MHLNGLVVAAAAAALAGGSAQAQDWPHPADIPRPGPVELAPAGQGRPDITRFLLVRGASQASLSPDGRWVAYMSTVTGEPQAWVVGSAGGAPRQLTFGEGIDGLTWAPDGSGVIYVADTGGDERAAFVLVSPEGAREVVVAAKTKGFKVFGDVSRDGRLAYAATDRNGRDFDIYVTDLKGSPARLAYQGTFGMYPGPWRPGAPEILVREARGEDGADLHILNVETGALRTLLKPKAAAEHADMAWLPDGSGFYLLSNNGRDLKGLAFYDMASGRLRYLETPDAEVAQVQVSRDGRWLAWAEDRGGLTQVRVRELASGRDVAVPPLPPGFHDIQLADSAPVLAVRTNGPRSVGEVIVVDLTSGAVTKPVETTWAGLDPAIMVEPERLTFKARDGVVLNGLYYRPKGVAGAPPLLLKLHGGPSSHAVAGFAADTQYYVSRGIAVFDFNYRGSTGSGKRFAELNDKRLRPNELNDIVDAVEWLAGTGRADRARLAVGGGSYGGYLTNAVLGAHPGLFRAAFSQVGVSDWVKALEGASPALKASDRVEYGDIDDPKDRAFFASISPINNAAKIRTPVLVQHGANDPRDPVTESDRLVSAIRQNGGEVVYLRFPDEGHGVVRRANRVHMYRRIAAFLEEKLGLGGGGAAQAGSRP
jgi:dipeptidyl aminopeptidase/acylaminoacyl peptidase